MALKRYSKRNVFGLNEALASKVDLALIRKTLDDVVSANNDSTIPSTAAVVALKTNLENQINEVRSFAQSLIDDSVDGGTDKTWSVDKIKQFVASVDDTVVVQTIADRDNLKPYDSLVCYVLDTSDDTELGPDFRGKPVAYIYADGKWHPISPLSKEIDSTVFVKYSDIVNDLTTGGANKPLSAEMGKHIANDLIPAAANSAKQELVTESVKITNNKITTTKPIVGALVFNCAEVATDEGIVVVDAVVSGDKEVTIQPDQGDNFEGKTARITYLAYIGDAAATTSTSSNDNGEADGAVANDNANSNSNTDNSNSNSNASDNSNTDNNANANS